MSTPRKATGGAQRCDRCDRLRYVYVSRRHEADPNGCTELLCLSCWERAEVEEVAS